jgi:DNA-binding transcriptional MerR regulator
MMADQPDDAWTDEGRRAGKSAEAFRTISEVSSALEVPQHVLRFWETKFVQVRPLKRAGGRRYYRPEDVTLLRSIRDLLYRDGYTIKGAGRRRAGQSPGCSRRFARSAPTGSGPARRGRVPGIRASGTGARVERRRRGGVHRQPKRARDSDRRAHFLAGHAAREVALV